MVNKTIKLFVFKKYHISLHHELTSRRLVLIELWKNHLELYFLFNIKSFDFQK